MRSPSLDRDTSARSYAVAPDFVQPPVDVYAADASLQRRAMLAMLLAMPVMLLGLPLHLAALFGLHEIGTLRRVIGWSSAALTTLTLIGARAEIRAAWVAVRHGRVESQTIVVSGAVSAYAASLLSLAQPAPHAPLYFDVAAMTLAWLVTGTSRELAVQRAFATTIAQLAPLNCRSRVRLHAYSYRERWALPFGALVFVATLVAVVGQWRLGAGAALFGGLATIACACPCAWGMANTTGAAGAERARAIGWIVPSGALFQGDDEQLLCAAVPLGAASREIFVQLARKTRLAWRLNRLWSIAGNVVLLPWAVRRPLDPLAPAAVMVLAWIMISLTQRVMIGTGGDRR